EELCRFCWVATVFFSLPYTIANGSMLRVGVLQDILPPRARRVLACLCDAATLLACVLLSCGAVRALRRVFESGELSSAILLPMWILYALLCAGLMLGAVRAAARFVRGVKGGGI
ncbi:MAG: TRAP transporter small permease, partial [Oscillospiraceae bacterium]|nr:TRAP transporter small permease [Oscillospiraceae bacterium]